MRKYLWSLVACLLLVATAGPAAYGQKNMGNPGQKQEQQVQLTEQQKSELAKLHKDILEKKKEMIQKYVEFGVIPEEKGQMMIAHFEKHYEMLEQNGFMMKLPPHHPMRSEPPKKPE
jgi:hypothetical protein